MLAFICLFFPAAASVWLFESIAKTDFSLKETVLRFATDALVINFLCLLVKKFVFGTSAESIYVNGDMIPNAAITYMAMATVFGLLFAILQVIFSKKIKVTVEEGTDEKKAK